MAHLYLGQWEWHTDAEDFSYWRAPGGGQSGTIDMRSLPQMAAAGGTPERLTWYPAESYARGWTPDGEPTTQTLQRLGLAAR